MLWTVLLFAVVPQVDARLLGADSQSPQHQQQRSSSTRLMSRVDELSQALHINDQDPNQDIRTNVALNLEWGI